MNLSAEKKYMCYKKERFGSKRNPNRIHVKAN